MFVIHGIGTATPPHSVEQQDAASIAHSLYQWSVTTSEQDANLRVQQIYAKAGVRTRHSVLLESSSNGFSAKQSFYQPAASANDPGPSTEMRMRRYEDASGPLAVEAARRALDDAGYQPESITHLITVSCSGFAAPGFDLELISQLCLSADIQRTHIGFMGCHGTLNGLRVANAFAANDPNARILLCAVELCSLHHQYCQRPDQIVANALFADGAAAVVGQASGDSGSWRLLANGSTIVPHSSDQLTWHIRDSGFHMSLSPRLPALIKHHLRPWLEEWLRRQHLSLDEVQSWVVHPGGPKILEACALSLGLTDESLATSHEVLAEFGNMSSPTVLFILDRLRRQGAKGPCVMLAFGPGVAIEAALFVD